METTQNPQVQNVVAKMPKLGDRPKRGIKDMTLTIVNKDAKFRPHHQKTLLIDLLEFKQGTATVEDLVSMIESNEDYWKRLDTVQSPYNCVVYHAKQLSEAGFLKIETVTSAGETQVKEKPSQDLIVEYARSKAPKVTETETITKEEIGDLEEVLGVSEEVKK